jgi:hypothetical protein
VPLTSNYPRRRLSAIVEGPGYPRPASGDLRQWAGQVVEKVRVASVGGRLRFLPWYDPYSDETPEMRQEYRHMLRESSVKAAFQTKVLSVISEDIQFQPDNEDDPREKEAASFYSYAFKRLKTRQLGWSILHPAVMDGHSVCEKVWDPDPLPSGKFKGKRCFKYVKAKDTRFLSLGIDPFRNITAIRGSGFNAGRVFSPSSFVIFSYFSLFENPAGMSDFRAAYRPYWIKDTLWKLRALHLEKWTGPFIVGHYTNQESKAALEAAFDDAKSSTWLTVPTGDVVECLDLAMKGTTDFKDGIADCDREMLIAIVGAHLQILEGQTGGARGNTKVHKEIGELIQWWLAATLADVYRDQIVMDLLHENYWDVEPPDVSIGAVTDEAMIERLKVYEGMQKLGLKLSQKAAYRSFNMQPPEDPDDVLTAPGQGLGGPAGPGGPPQPPGAPPDQGGNGQALSEKEVRQGPAPFGGGSDRWPYGFSEAGWHAFAAASAQRKVGEKWQGPSGKWFTKRQDGRVVPTAAPGPQEQGGGKPAAKPAPTPTRPVAGKADRAKEAAAVKQAAFTAAKAIAADPASATPEHANAIGRALLTLNVADLQGLKKQLGIRGGDRGKAALVASIKERARAVVLASRAKPTPPPKVPPPVPAAAPKASAKARNVEVTLGETPAHRQFVVDAIAKVFPGMDPGSVPFARMVGAPDGTKVKVVRGGPGNTLEITLRGEGLFAMRKVTRTKDGRLVMVNDLFKIEETGTGLGSQVFFDQVDACVAAGFDEIRCDAAGGPGEIFNGFYTWPRMGYDHSLVKVNKDDELLVAVARDARKQFPGVKSVLDLMASPGGREWWKQNGCFLDGCQFDLAEGSRSRQVLAAYQEERAKAGGTHAESDNSPPQGKEQIDLAPWEEEALDRAWKRLEGKLPPAATEQEEPAE